MRSPVPRSPEYMAGYKAGYRTGIRNATVITQNNKACWIMRKGDWYCSCCGTKNEQAHEDYCCKCGCKMNSKEATYEDN